MSRETQWFTSEMHPGLKLSHKLRGHSGEIRRLAWSPDGKKLASPSSDQTVRIWDTVTGRLLHTLKGHEGIVYCVSWSPDGRIVASGGGDHRIILWDVESGELADFLHGHRGWVNALIWPQPDLLASGSEDTAILLWDVANRTVLHRLEGHGGNINGLTSSPDGLLLASASGDTTIRLWNADTGKVEKILKGHKDWVFSVAWHPDGKSLVSGSWDNTIGQWDIQTGRLIRVIEGHPLPLSSVSVSYDGRLVATKCGDDNVRIWRYETWELLTSVHEPRSPRNSSSLAFHPFAPKLATLGERDTVIRLWDVDAEALLSRGISQQRRYHTTARIVLVGDSGVGKTGLGWRLAHGEFKEHASTHGQQVWVCGALGTKRADGTECEAVLWDLAGQPDYRLIQSLFLDDADLALVLFDPTDPRDPLHGVEFWLNQLNLTQALLPASPSPAGRSACVALLVAARCDRGAPTLTHEELEAFCRQRGLAGYVRTSARSGEGLADLLARMKSLVAWEEKPTTVTTATFKRIKDYVLALKETGTDGQVLVSAEELRARLEATDGAWRFSDEEMLTSVGHLETYGYVRRLRTSRGERRVLLAPELLNNLAASFVLEARRNARGLGALEERRLFGEGERYAFPEYAGLSAADQTILTDAAALLFLDHHTAFRETDPLTAQSFLIFPDLINLKRPVDEEQASEDGVAYTVSGAVANVFASLVVLLGYTSTFTRIAHWQNNARYGVGDGSACGFRLAAQRDGELDLTLCFSPAAPRPVRMLFQGLFESFLGRRNLGVLRHEPVTCGKCGRRLDRVVARQRLQEGATFTFCNGCGEKLALAKEEPIQQTRAQAAQVEAQRRQAEARTRFEQAVFRVQAYVAEQKITPPECFISYAWGDLAYERWVEKSLATDLQKAGLAVVLDRWENAKIGASVSRFVERIEKVDRVVVVGTPAYRKKYENKDTATGYVVAAEVDVIADRLLGTEPQKESVLPALLAGDEASSFPPLLKRRVYADFRTEEAYFATAFNLILSLYNIPPAHPAVADLFESLRPGVSR